MKHWVKGGYYYYHNLETQEGGWDEPPGFVQNSLHLAREEIQVGPLSSRKRKLKESVLELMLVRRGGRVVRSPKLKLRLHDQLF